MMNYNEGQMKFKSTVNPTVEEQLMSKHCDSVEGHIVILFIGVDFVVQPFPLRMKIPLLIIYSELVHRHCSPGSVHVGVREGGTGMKSS
ncbi:hypothetical protein SADUNF_Sadunf02G0145300 [Salix dunnii]|uniref:Uncharacterized protein n=1 Tax=Salix dunnii TaxID=1413687 RepID=A0A835N806_9ROSI|nr:hypothetical protein SADUNF_Sadunf02G0145300 [Salix dunnii]